MSVLVYVSHTLMQPRFVSVPEPYYTGRYLDGVEVTLTATPLEEYPRLRGNGRPVGRGESGNVGEGRKRASWTSLRGEEERELVPRIS